MDKLKDWWAKAPIEQKVIAVVAVLIVVIVLA